MSGCMPGKLLTTTTLGRDSCLGIDFPNIYYFPHISGKKYEERIHGRPFTFSSYQMIIASLIALMGEVYTEPRNRQKPW